MGCGSSKAAGLISVKPQGPGDTSNKAPVLTNSEVPAEVKRSASQASLRSTKTGRSMLSLKARKERENQEREPESSDSLSSLDIRSSGQEVKSERASAKSSRTVDSGIGEEYAHIITEHSDQERKQAVENEKRLPMPDLHNGTSVASANLRHALSVHNPDPQNISIVERPASRSGRAFDITFTNGGTPNKKKVPPQLARLQAPKRKHVLTREELEAKLRKAEERRQESECRLLQKLAQQNDKDLHAHQALQTFADTESKKLEEQLSKSMEKNHSNREEYLKSLRDKLRAKENHAKVVRENKQNMLAARDTTES